MLLFPIALASDPAVQQQLSAGTSAAVAAATFAFANKYSSSSNSHYNSDRATVATFNNNNDNSGHSMVASGSEEGTSSNAAASLCLGFADIFTALVLVLLILATVLGNVLVVLSVFMYKRMRTFTNFLLTSLATADLLVGMLIMPLSLLDLLHNHNWPLGKALCRIWATFDVLLCTASIMAITSPLLYPRRRSKWMAFALLCFVWGISLVVCSPPWLVDEWGISFDSKSSSSSALKSAAIEFPQFFHHQQQLDHQFERVYSGSGVYQCAYPMSVSYRIYSASVSFYIPLVVMLFVYFKIFRVASERERLIREGMGTCRLSRRVEKTQLKCRKRSATTNYTHRSTAPRMREVMPAPASDQQMRKASEHTIIANNHCPVKSSGSSNPSIPPLSLNRSSVDRTSSGQMTPCGQQVNSTACSPMLRDCPAAEDVLSCDSEETNCASARNSARGVDGTRITMTLAMAMAAATNAGNGGASNGNREIEPSRCADSFKRKIKSMECLGAIDRNAQLSSKYRKNSAEPAPDNTVEHADFGGERRPSAQTLQPPQTRQQRMAMANGGSQQLLRQQNSCSSGRQNSGKCNKMEQMGHFSAKNANLRGSKEKIVYLRERKALKTIGIVVLGFIVCWLPFFVVYLLEVSPLLKKTDISKKRGFQLLAEFFLWLGYSNSVLNPLIYTMYNTDFRRCFRDLLGFGCFSQHRRTMSVKKLHQQSTVF